MTTTTTTTTSATVTKPNPLLRGAVQQATGAWHTTARGACRGVCPRCNSDLLAVVGDGAVRNCCLGTLAGTCDHRGQRSSFSAKMRPAVTPDGRRYFETIRKERKQRGA